MKDFLTEMASYNKNANIKMIETVSLLDSSIIYEDAGVYYKSIAGTVEHIGLSEVIWLKRYTTFFSYPSISSEPLLKEETSSIKNAIDGDFTKGASLVKEADSIFIKFINEVDEKQLNKRVKYKNIMGEELEREYWNTIFHVLNHGTHHRGEISALLDMKKIQNDYSGFTKYTK